MQIEEKNNDINNKDPEKPIENPVGIELTNINNADDEKLLNISDRSADELKIQSDDDVEEKINESQYEAKQSKQAQEIEENKCCSCCNKQLFQGTVAIIIFIAFDLIYLGDMLTMLGLFWSNNGGGIQGCDCNAMHITRDCQQCWNCIWSETATSCSNFNANIDILQYWFPILCGYCIVGWLLNEITIWIRICCICHVYNNEYIKYKEKRDRETEELVMENNANYFKSKYIQRPKDREYATIHNKAAIHRNQTLISYDKEDYDNDVIGLIPCCFEDVDEYHMKKILMMNTEHDEFLYDSNYQIDDNNSSKLCNLKSGDIGQKCCECPCFMFSFSISICWLFPFRYFWHLAVCDFTSVFWKRLCWFGVFHAVTFDICWILFCRLIHDALSQAQRMGINDYFKDLGVFIERKMYMSFAMIIIILIIWLTVPLFLLMKTTDSTKNKSYAAVTN